MTKKAKKRVVKTARRGPVILPKKMSSLIAICLKDIKKAEALPKKFVVDMSSWFQPEDINCETSDGVVIETHHVCTVCAAGAVMAFSLKKADTNDELFPDAFPRNEKQLDAINYLRTGDVFAAARALELIDFNEYGDANEGDRSKYEGFETSMPEYKRDNPKPFHTAMGKLHDKLKKAGL